MLALYDEIASKVASEIKLVIDSSTRSRSERSQQVDAGAYDEYLRGMFFLGNRWMAGGCRNAERSLLDAAHRDPDFAPTYAALAWCYAYPDRLGREVADVGPKAKAAVARALSLDDRQALAHAVAGTIKWRVDYDVPGGELELRRGLELDPNSALVLLPMAEFFLWRGKAEQAYPLLDRALALDPFSTDRNVQVGFALLVAGRYQAAIADFRRALEIDPHYMTAQLWLAEAYSYLDDRDTAVGEYLNWLDETLRPERASAARATLQLAYRGGGWSNFWRGELELAEAEVGHPGSVWIQPYTRYTGPWFMARRYARLGEWDRALDALDAAYTARHHLMATLTLEPLFTALRPTARFRELQRKTASPN
jgi:Tfp pilus assembly protein PilF